MNTSLDLNLLLEPYGIKAIHSKKLEGYGSTNYKVTTENSSCLLKFYADPKDRELIEGENLALKHLSSKTQLPTPKVLNDIQESEDGSFTRILSFINGSFLTKKLLTKNFLYSLGETAGKLDTELSDFSNSAIQARRSTWDIQYLHLNQNKLQFIPNTSDHKLANYFIDSFIENILPIQHSLRHQIIHGDLNENNLIVSDDSITGIIDFGDICYSPVINEVATAMAYVIMLHPEKGIEYSSEVLKGYHSEFALQREEIPYLYYLIAAKACCSVLHSAESKAKNGATEYILQNEKPAWSLLKLWIQSSPTKVTNAYLNVLGFSEVNANSVELLEKRTSVSSAALSLSYNEPIHMVRAAFQYMFDANGNTYLDAYNNIPHVGHCHPHISKVVSEKVRSLNTNTRYLFHEYTSYSEKLLSLFPDKLAKLLLVNSGSAASDLAIRIARAHTKRNHIAVLSHGYHGNTMLAINASAYKFDGKGGSGTPNEVIKLPLPKLFMGTQISGIAYANEAISILEKAISDGNKPAAFIAEPISGCGGQVPLAAGYLEHLHPFLEKHQILLIADEVQTGFGRIGSHFWGHELHGVTPDIVILGKPMGNGHPIGGVVCTSEISNSFSNGMEFFSSFGGNPISCAIGEAVLDIIEKEKLQKNAMEVGLYWLEKLEELKGRYSVIADVRGHGIFIGVELMHLPSKTPATEVAQLIKNKMKDHFILTSTDGPYDNVLKMKAPLCFSKENVDEFQERLVQSFDFYLATL